MALVVHALVVAAVPAHADVSLSASTEPGVVIFPGTTELTYTLRLVDDGGPERVTVAIRPAWSYTRGPAGSLQYEGVPLGWQSPARVSGDAVVEAQGITQALPACSPRRNVPHGYEPHEERLGLLLLGGGEALIATRWLAGAVAPWPDTSYALSFDVGPGPGSSLAPRTVRSPAPRRDGATGVRIELSTDPATAPVGGHPEPPTLRAGRALRIGGTTDPALPGQTISLRFLGPSSASQLEPLADVRVGPDGRFAYTWRPTRPGSYELWPLYRSQRGDLVDDYSCPHSFRIEGQSVAEDEPASGKATVRSRRARLTRRRRLVLTVTCRTDRCRGTLRVTHAALGQVGARAYRLDRGRHRLGVILSRRFAAALTRSLRLRVSAGGRRVVVRPPRDS